MTCQELAAFMLEYVEDTLPADVRRRFDAHLAVCADCVHYLADYRATVDTARALGAEGQGEPPAMPEALVRAILDSRRSRSSAQMAHDLSAGGGRRRRGWSRR